MAYTKTIGLPTLATLFSWVRLVYINVPWLHSKNKNVAKNKSQKTPKRVFKIAAKSKLTTITLLLTTLVPALSIPNFVPISQPVFLSKYMIWQAEHKEADSNLKNGQISQAIKFEQFKFQINLPTDPDLTVISQEYQSYHPAIDLAISYGLDVKPILPGKVIEAGWDSYGKGKTVTIEHADNLKSLYAHLSKTEVKVGDEVGQDTPIGKIGLTGRTTGAHLHLEIYDNNQSVNPQNLLPYFEPRIALK